MATPACFGWPAWNIQISCRSSITPVSARPCWGKKSGTTVIRNTGAVMFGPKDSEVIAGTLAAAHDLPVVRLTREELQQRLPQHRNPKLDHIGIWDPEASVAHPEAGINPAVDAARAAGATIYTDTMVKGIELIDGGVIVTAPMHRFTVDQVVVTAGAWLNKLVSELPLTPLRRPIMWFKPADRSDPSFGLENFPTFIHAVNAENWFWGHGSGNGFAVKVGPDRDPNYREVDPDTIDRGISPAGWKLVSELVSKALPGLNPIPVLTTNCMVTHSPDGRCQIGRPYNDPRLIVSVGCCGHAFKHAGGIGEIIAQMPTPRGRSSISTSWIQPGFSAAKIERRPARSVHRPRI